MLSQEMYQVAEPNRDDEQEVMRLERELIAAFLEGDTSALDHILADDFIFTDPHSAPLTKTEWLEDLTSGHLTFESINIDDLQVSIHGDTALANGRVTMKAKSKQGGYSGQYHYTDVYVRQEGRWRAILSTARHAKNLHQ
jgi:ketosteroid isomerase-like protein